MLSSLPTIMLNRGGDLDEKTTQKLDLVEKLIGKIKEGKYIKKRYLQMVLSSSIPLDTDKIQLINQSQKLNNPITILDKSKLKPDPKLQKLVNINPVLVQKSATIEDIKAEQDKYKSLMAKHKSLSDLLRDDQDDIMQNIKERCEQQNDAFQSSNKIIAAQNRIKALANSNGAGLDTFKSEDIVKKFYMRNLNDRIRMKNSTSFSSSQILDSSALQKLNRDPSFDSTPNLSFKLNHGQNIYQLASNNGMSKIESQTTLNPRRDVMSPLIKKNPKLIKSNTLNANSLSISSIPEQRQRLSNLSQPKNFEIKLQSIDIIDPLPSLQQNHSFSQTLNLSLSKDTISQKMQLKNKRLNTQFIVQDTNQTRQSLESNLNEFMTVSKQQLNSKNQTMQTIQQNQSLTNENGKQGTGKNNINVIGKQQVIQYQPIKQQLHNEYINLSLDSKSKIPRRIKHVPSKSFSGSNQSAIGDKVQVSQDTQISDTFYARFPNIVPDPSNNRNNNIQLNQRTSVYEKIGTRNNIQGISPSILYKDSVDYMHQNHHNRQASISSDNVLNSEYESQNDLNSSKDGVHSQSSQKHIVNINSLAYKQLFQPTLHSKSRPVGFMGSMRKSTNNNGRNNLLRQSDFSFQDSQKSSIELRVTKEAIESYRQRIQDEEQRELTKIQDLQQKQDYYRDSFISNSQTLPIQSRVQSNGQEQNVQQNGIKESNTSQFIIRINSKQHLNRVSIDQKRVQKQEQL
eukprot:403332996